MTRADKRPMETREGLTEGCDMLIDCDRKFAADKQRTDRKNETTGEKEKES